MENTFESKVGDIKNMLQIGFFSRRILEQMDLEGAGGELRELMERLRGEGVGEEELAKLVLTAREGVGQPVVLALPDQRQEVILVLLRLEMARRSELIFLANLGYSFLHVGLVVAVECVLLEAVLRIALA